MIHEQANGRRVDAGEFHAFAWPGGCCWLSVRLAGSLLQDPRESWISHAVTLLMDSVGLRSDADPEQLEAPGRIQNTSTSP